MLFNPAGTAAAAMLLSTGDNQKHEQQNNGFQVAMQVK